MSPSLLALTAAGVLLLSASGAARAANPIQVRFLFDLGDGTYAWADTAVADPTAPNATWSATLAAATSVGLYVSWAWSSTYGVYVLDVGNRSPPGGVGLYQWNGTSGAWDPLLVGLSSLVLKSGDALAISDNGFDPVTFAQLVPVPTPLDPYPVLEFRGDAANTGSSGSPAPNLFGVKWDTDLHLTEIPASPAVGYGRAYILTLDGLFALDLSNGHAVWSNTSIHGLSTPAVFDGTLLFGGTDGRLHAVDAANGTEAWNVSLIAKPLFSGITSSPKLLWDTAYVGTFNESGGPGDVVALWATNGTVLWDVRAPGSVSYSSPAIADGALYVGVIGKYNTTTQVTYDPPYGILSLDAATGAQRWFHATNGSVAASPLVVGSEVIVPSKDGYVYALNATTGAPLWKAAVDAGVSSPALVRGEVVVAGGSYGGAGRVTALDPATGAVLWTFTPNGPVQSSVAAADGKVFFSTNVANGTVYAVNASSGRIVWAYTPAPPQYIFGSPVVSDGMVLAPSDNGHVYAFAPTVPALTDVVNANVPSELSLGQTGNITVHVFAPDGTWDDVVVKVQVSLGTTVVATSVPASESGGVLTADLGRVLFGQSASFTVTVRGDATGSWPVVVSAIGSTPGSDFAYGPNVPAIQVGSTAPPASPFPWLLAVAATGLAAVLVVAVALAFRRRRVRGP